MERILIIEDEKDVNRLLSQALQNHNYQTISTYNGMALMESRNFRLALLI